MSECTPPKCHKTRRGCRCPNPWTEFQARESMRRKRENLKRFSRAEMSKLYRRVKQSGKFASVQNSPCKGNETILCAWNAERRGTQTREESEHSLLRDYPLDARNNVPCDWKEEGHDVLYDKFTKRWLPIAQMLLPNFQYQFMAKGSSKENLLALFREKRSRGYLLVRITDVDGKKVPLEYMYGAQKVFEKKLGKLVPRIHFAHSIQAGGEEIRIIGTDAVQGVLEDLLSDTNMRKKTEKMPICRKLKGLLDVLKEKRLEHGDLHFDNVSYRMADDGSVEYLGMIDFELSGPLRRKGGDLASVLTSAYSDKILEFMKRIVDLPKWFSSAIEKGLDPIEEMGSVYPGSSFQYRNPYEVMKMPLIRL